MKKTAGRPKKRMRKINDSVDVLVIELAKDLGYKLSKNEKTEIATELLDLIYTDFDTVAHNVQADFVC